jgi:hypothetical protein
MNNAFIGKNQRNVSIFVYYQICHECGEPIVGIKESTKGEIYMNPNDAEGIIFLTKQRRKEMRDNK